MIEVQIPLTVLKAMRLLAPKKDIRSYLCGVALSEGHAVASNGHYLGAYRIGTLDVGTPEIIIPNAAIDAFTKKVGRTTIDMVTVRWQKKPAEGASVAYGWLTNGIEEERFLILEWRYIPFKRVLAAHTEAKGNPQFQWSYLALFEKVAETLGVPAKVATKVFVVPNGSIATARLFNYSHPEFQGAIMPVNWKEDAPVKAVEEDPAEDLV